MRFLQFLKECFLATVITRRHRHKGTEKGKRQSAMIERGWIDDRYNGANFPPAMMIPQLPKSVFSSQFDALCEHTIAVTEPRWITSLYFARKQAEDFIFYVCFLTRTLLTLFALELPNGV